MEVTLKNYPMIYLNTASQNLSIGILKQNNVYECYTDGSSVLEQSRVHLSCVEKTFSCIIGTAGGFMIGLSVSTEFLLNQGPGIFSAIFSAIEALNTLDEGAKNTANNSRIKYIA